MATEVLGYVSPDDEIAHLERQLADADHVLIQFSNLAKFFRSAIQCGDEYTERCREEYEAAMNSLVGLWSKR